MFHRTITFTANYCKEEVNFLDLNIKVMELEADLFVNFADSHQCLDPTSSHPYHCKKTLQSSFKA